MFVRGVEGFVSEYSSRCDYPEWCSVFFHCSSLDWGCVCSEDESLVPLFVVFASDEECVLHVSCWVVCGNVDPFEVVVF